MLISLSRYSMLAHLLAGIWYAHNIGSVPSDLPVRAGFVVQRDLRATSNNVSGVALGSLHSSAWGGKVSWGSRLSTRRARDHAVALPVPERYGEECPGGGIGQMPGGHGQYTRRKQRCERGPTCHNLSRQGYRRQPL